MKTRVLSILALLLMTATGAKAETVTWDTSNVFIKSNMYNTVDEFNPSAIYEGITISFSGPDVSRFTFYDHLTSKAGIVVYGEDGDSFTFTAPTGKKFVRIEINSSEEGYVFDGCEGWSEFSDYQLVWSGTAANAVTLGTGYTAMRNITSIVFYFEETSVTANAGAVAGEYWSTFYNASATQGYTADASTTVYKAALNGTSSVTLTEVAGREIPAGQAVILKSTAASITLTPATTTADMSGNVLKGGTTVASGNDAYTLSRGSAGTGPVGFYKFSGATLDGSKAHLEIPTSAARSFIGFGDDNTTAIELPALADDEAAEWYSLDGRRLSGKPARKGIYVKDGQKYIIR